MLPPIDTCDDCVPDYVKHSASHLPRLAIASLPFILTFLLVATAVSHKLFPLLSGRNHDAPPPPSRNSFPELRPSIPTRLGRFTRRTVAGVVFSTNIALSAVLVELILCEIASAADPAARSLALKIVLPSLLFLLIVATPALEIHSVLAAAGWGFAVGKKGRRLAWVLEGVGLGIWLLGFWYAGRALLGGYLHEESYVRDHSLSEGCLERIGIIGVSLMASLAGFAAVSSLWQTFGVKFRLVSCEEGVWEMCDLGD
jgi:hypothetical protein